MDLKGWIKGAFNIDKLVKPTEPAKVETPKTVVENTSTPTPAPKPAPKVEETKPVAKPATTAKPSTGQLEELPWIAELRKHIGLAEVKGPKHNPTIVQWLKDMGKYSGENKSWYYEDESAWCLTGDIEVLTSDGFIRLDEINGILPEAVAMLDPITKEVKFTKDYDIIHKDYEGVVYNFKKRGLVCDPDHKFYGRWTGTGQDQLRKVKHLTKYGVGVPCITTSAPGVNATDKELEFLAAYLSDGHLPSSKKVRFHLSKTRKMELLDKYPYLRKSEEKKVYGVSTKVCFTYVFDISLLRLDYIDKNKTLHWPTIRNFSKEQAKVFIDAYSQFDGTQTNNGFEVFTANPVLWEQLNYLATMAGYKSTPYKVKQVSPNSKIEYLYHVYVSRSKRRYFRPENFKKEDFKGTLYCLTVPTSIMIIRTTKGIIMPIGNCGLAVGHALGVSGRFVVPEWFRALKWSDEKYLTKLDKPAYGCIGVKERKGGGHVFFVVGLISPGYVACLGGNQGDKVSIIPIAIKDIKGFYWPSKWENKQCVKQTPNPLRYDLKIVSATGRLGASEA